ncbi:hypothetical protein DB30_07647 [Enhygromyxa salina]|uniref:Uncharacterized protein n=1 Tax=Enhygromyxa salina TaxID=215803 RepID=A0A0C2CRJ7_9BACT|nr:hypothetical protein [Enhygromyxa salina]KIG13801.1 hypothetical protein DB30_07647 [Enhygromyxa salina]
MGDEHEDHDEQDDALEDEFADTVRPPETLPITLTLPALVLTAAIALPLHPDGFSFAQLLYASFLRSPLEGLIMLLGFGSPFCFGAIVLALAWLGDRVHPRLAERLLVANLSLLHAQLVLVAFLLWSRDQGKMPLALLGFAVVSGGYFILHHAREAAASGGADDTAGFSRSGPTLRWLVHWGATVIVAVCGWIRLQLLIGVRLGWAIEVMLAAAVTMAVLLTRKRS